MHRVLVLAYVLQVVEAFSPPTFSHRSRNRVQSGVSSRRAAPCCVESDLSLFSPAKTNLFLRILRKREDGFHELASVFQALSIGDTLHFSPHPDAAADILSCNVPGMPLDGSNLIIKAFELYRRRTGQSLHFSCHVEKNTPMEGGMGGGSSNAATALYAANLLCGSIATEEQLIEWGGELGSDVSFFLSSGTAYCTGRGEVIDSLPPLATPTGSMWLVKPEEGCPTGAVYKGLGLMPGQELPGSDPDELKDKMLAEGISQAVCVNDLEAPAQGVLPKLVDIKQALADAGFHTILLSGSGATTFAVHSDGSANPTDALKGAGQMQESTWIEGPIHFVSREPGKSWYSKSA